MNNPIFWLDPGSDNEIDVCIIYEDKDEHEARFAMSNPPAGRLTVSHFKKSYQNTYWVTISNTGNDPIFFNLEDDNNSDMKRSKTIVITNAGHQVIATCDAPLNPEKMTVNITPRPNQQHFLVDMPEEYHAITSAVERSEWLKSYLVKQGSLILVNR